jgi:methyl halide transferase
MSLKLDADFWNERYLKGDTPWNIEQASPPLTNYLDQLENKSIKILIPGAGHAHEANYLLEKGFFDITICDISENAMEKLKTKIPMDSVTLITGDFFELKGKYDLILEQTFFCALNPSLRKNYINKTYDLLNDGGKIVGVLFDRIFEQEGPPFGGTKEEYEHLFSKKYYIQKLEKCYNSIVPRLGHEVFFICVR